MARNGFRIFDADTHVGPVMEVLEKYLTDAERAKLPAWEQYKNIGDRGFSKGLTSYTRGVRSYGRVLGATNEDNKLMGYTAAFTGRKKEHEPSPQSDFPEGFSGPTKMEREPSTRVDFDPAVRIQEMDLEGVDVNLMLPSGWYGTWTGTDDVALEAGMYRAYHRWMNDYCGAYPERLGGVLLISARDIPGSVEEIRRWSKSRWAWGVQPYAPSGMSLDHPALEAIWATAQEYDLVVTLHTSTAMPPYAPGGQDNWENVFLQRSAAHPWCGMRNMAALIGSGVMDRYPRLRIGTLEAGHGWLPFWLARIDEHAETCAISIPKLKHKPSEYAMSGRYFQSIEMHEGAKITNSVAELIGDDVLMFGSDYPHLESRFPKSVDIVMGWDMPEVRKRKLFWDNPAKFYARSGLN